MNPRPLADRLAAMLPSRPRIAAPAYVATELLDLFVPRLRRAHVWNVIAFDREQLHDMFDDTADWAAERGWKVTIPGNALSTTMLIHTAHGACRIEGSFREDAAMKRDDAVASDMMPVADVVAAATEVPVFLFGTADRQPGFRPPHPHDRLMIDDTAPRPDQVIARLRAAGATVIADTYTQILGTGARAGLRDALMEMTAAATERHPRARARIAAWEVLRLRQLRAGRLALHRQRRDILVLPGPSPED